MLVMKFGSDIGSLIWAMDEGQRKEFWLFINEMKKQGLDLKLKQGTDISCDEILKSIDSTNEFEKKQAEAEERAANGETSVPEDRWGVHENHCCKFHGCKYGDIDCPVTMNLTSQIYPCETCSDGTEDNPDRIFVKE